MIVIELINQEGTLVPERQLTVEEQSTVVYSLSNGVTITHYQQDDELEISENNEIN